MIEVAERLYPNNPLGVYYLNWLRKSVEDDCPDYNDESRA
jgi:hypothetical protein